MTKLRFGLDFGTSNSAVAVTDGAGVRLLPIDPIGGDTMPSVLYVQRDSSALVGHPAIQAFLEDNRNRGPVQREFKLLVTRPILPVAEDLPRRSAPRKHERVR